MKRCFFLGCLILLQLLSCGCGTGDGRLPCFEVGGRVMVNGEPASGVEITFHPVDPKKAAQVKSGATTAQDGSYKLSTYDMIDGAPAGEYTVTLKWMQMGGDEGSKSADQFKGAFADPTKTKYKTTVRDQPDNTYNIDIRIQE